MYGKSMVNESFSSPCEELTRNLLTCGEVCAEWCVFLVAKAVSLFYFYLSSGNFLLIGPYRRKLIRQVSVVMTIKFVFML